MVRMWMCDTRILCRQHLLGEHNEIHKLVGSINKGKSIKGYLENNCVEISSIHLRHHLLIDEMKRRGYKHSSQLPSFSILIFLREKSTIIDRTKNLALLLSRCEECKKRFYDLINK